MKLFLIEEEDGSRTINIVNRELTAKQFEQENPITVLREIEIPEKVTIGNKTMRVRSVIKALLGLSNEMESDMYLVFEELARVAWEDGEKSGKENRE